MLRRPGGGTKYFKPPPREVAARLESGVRTIRPCASEVIDWTLRTDSTASFDGDALVALVYRRPRETAARGNDSVEFPTAEESAGPTLGRPEDRYVPDGAGIE